MITEIEWTRKYKQALLEREPALRALRIEEAYELMTRRSSEIAKISPEQQVLRRALDILVTVRQVSASIVRRDQDKRGHVLSDL